MLDPSVARQAIGRAAFPVLHETMRLAMKYPLSATPNLSESAINLIKDGGRRVMYGGDPYEDDVEPDVPAPAPSNGGSAGAGGKI